MDCLKKALKTADICATQAKNRYLFVVILNKYLYYFSLEHSFVSAEEVGNVIELNKEHLD